MKDERGNTRPPTVECSSCGLRSQTQPDRYANVLAKIPGSIAELATSTFPRLPLNVAGRVMWEEHAIGHTLQLPERQQALQEAYLTLSYLVANRLDVGSFLGFFVLFSVPACFLGMVLSAPFFDKKEQDGLVGLVVVLILAIMVPFCVWVTRRSQRKKNIRKVLPMLSKALRPLRPTLDELRSISSWAAAMRQPVGTLVSAQQLFNAISSLPDRSLVHADEMDLIEEARRMHAELNPPTDPPRHAEDSIDRDDNTDLTH